MSGYWSAITRAAGAPDIAAGHAVPREVQPFEDLRGPGEDGFVEVDPEPAGITPAAQPPVEAPVASALQVAVPPATASDQPATPGPVADSVPPPLDVAAGPDRSGALPAVAVPTLPPSAPHAPPSATAIEPAPQPREVQPQPVGADRAFSPSAPDAPPPVVPAPLAPAAPQPVTPVSAVPSDADPADPVHALPAIMVSALAEQIAQSIAPAEPHAPPPILITIEQLEIRLGDQAPAAGTGRRERPAPVVPLDRFLRRNGDAS